MRAPLKIFLALIFLVTFSSAQTPIVIIGGTLIDGLGPVVENSAIVIQGTNIIASGPRNLVRIPLEATIIDATGKYIIPGLIDCHVHYEKPRDLVQMLAWGVTSVNCMFESTDQALAMEKMTANDTVHSPQIYATAPIFSCKGGWWEGDGFPIDSSINRFPETPDQARAAVRKAKEKGIKRIKLMYDDMSWCRDPLPRLAKVTRDVAAALLEESNEQKLFLEIHVPQMKDASEILEAEEFEMKKLRQDGDVVDYQRPLVAFAHGILDDSFIAADVMTRLKPIYISTFCVFEFLADTRTFMRNALSDKRFSSALPNDIISTYTSEEYYDRYSKRYPNIGFVKNHLATLRSNLITLNQLYNLTTPLGTDMWAFPGIGVHLELEYMVKAGLKPVYAIGAATLEGAAFLRATRNINTLIHAGHWENIEYGPQVADLLVLDANPLDDIRNTRSVRTIIKHGKVFDHQQLIEESKKMN